MECIMMLIYRMMKPGRLCVQIFKRRRNRGIISLERIRKSFVLYLLCCNLIYSYYRQLKRKLAEVELVKEE